MFYFSLPMVNFHVLAIRHNYSSYISGIFLIGGDLVTSRSIFSWMLISAHVCKITHRCLHFFEAGCITAVEMVALLTKAGHRNIRLYGATKPDDLKGPFESWDLI